MTLFVILFGIHNTSTKFFLNSERKTRVKFQTIPFYQEMSHVFCLNNFTCNHDADDQNDESSISYASDFNQMSIACCCFL